MKQPILALIYDFDNTLAVKDMQSFSFIPALGLGVGEFWDKTNELSVKYDTDKILSYLFVMVDECKKRGIKLTREYLEKCGQDITYFPGVNTWFDRINEYGKQHGVIVEHYVISCGNLEILNGCSIKKKFKKIFACEYIYDEKGEAYWPKVVINYTGKTQYIYRIKKGIMEDNDDIAINEKSVHKRVPLENMIYIGDGLTDVPAMLTVKESGGTSIAVYPEGKREKVINYYEDDRVNYICKSDYSKGSELEKIVQLIIEQTHIRSSLEERQKKAEK